MPPFSSVEFVGACGQNAVAFAGETPQVVFAGRSNVGKSSLINALAGKKVARTSSRPGATRTLNFFRVDRRFWFVDLPGYGFAKASMGAREEWGRWVVEFLRSEVPARLSVLLVDGLVGPTPLDLDAIEWLSEPGRELIVVATKWDRVPKSRRQPERERVERALRSVAKGPVVTVSTISGEGIRELAKYISDFFERSLASQPQERKAEHAETDDAGSSGRRRARRS